MAPGLMLAGASAVAAVPPGAAAAVDVLLQEAERVRSSDPARLAALLAELDGARHAATRGQRDHIAYLRAYREAFSGRYAGALEEARALVDDGADPSLRLRARALIVTIHGLSRQFTDGLRELESLHAEIPGAQDLDAKRQALFASATLYHQVGQHGLAIRDLDALLARTSPMDARDQCMVMQLRQAALQASGQRFEESAVQATIDQCDAAGEPLVANMARLSLAREMAESGRVEAAVAYMAARMDEVEATRYPRLVTEAHSTLADWLLSLGDHAGARRHANRAIAQATGETSLLPLTTAHRVLYEIAESAGDVRGALDHYRRYAEANKAYLNDVNAREFAYQIVRRETQQQNQQIELLDQQNQVLVLQQRVSEQAAQNTRLLIALLVFLLATIGYWAWHVTRRHNSLRRLAEVDSLTAVDNRRHFMLQAEQTLRTLERQAGTVAMVMLDLDHFKKINDTFGHVTGDWVLEQVARACRGLCRRVDRIGRLGGEEFAILLPGCDAAAAARVAGQCRERIAAIDTAPSGQAFPLTASCGVTDTSQSGFVLSRLLSHADQALYSAKHDGRNVVRVYDGERDLRRRRPGGHPAGGASQPA